MNINNLLKEDFYSLSGEDEKAIVEHLASRLKIEFEKKDKSGIYGLTQYRFAYNSNHIEGSTLTENQTRELFQNGTIHSDEEVFVAKDIEEGTGHFMMFNEMLATYEEELTQELIKKYHFRLKSGVWEDMANGYPCGEYKNRINRVSDIAVVHPLEVEGEMRRLLDWYNTEEKTLKTIGVFHACYERIHPFQDGNGRTGRMILFKESLKNGIVPAIVNEEDRNIYMQSLHLAQTEKDYEELVDFLKKKQADYYKNIRDFLWEY